MVVVVVPEERGMFISKMSSANVLYWAGAATTTVVCGGRQDNRCIAMHMSTMTTGAIRTDNYCLPTTRKHTTGCMMSR